MTLKSQSAFTLLKSSYILFQNLEKVFNLGCIPLEPFQSTGCEGNDKYLGCVICLFDFVKPLIEIAGRFPVQLFRIEATFANLVLNVLIQMSIVKYHHNLHAVFPANIKPPEVRV